MARNITIISTNVVNCYLLKIASGFILIDAGISFQRGALKKALKQAGCGSGDINLVILTHADFDHTGNCVWLRNKYGAIIAMHREDSAAVESGRMLLSRKNRRGIIAGALMNFGGLLIFRRFKPDVFFSDGEDLSRYGLEARVIHIPGHSLGSIGVLTKDGDFFCGDLLVNGKKPAPNPLIDDAAEINASIEKLRSLNIKTVYPGHGKPFAMEPFLKDYSLHGS
jgi:glyoxylase-like metal-dependent hydrolase (beta-lactamase superfamily II)